MIETAHALIVVAVLCGAVVILALVDRVKEGRRRRPQSGRAQIDALGSEPYGMRVDLVRAGLTNLD